jgi:Tol biopolymer transport system component
VTLLACAVAALAAGCAYSLDSSGDGEPDPWSIEVSDSCPHWSPDGESIAFSRRANAADILGQYDVYVATPSGHARKITRTKASETVIGWLADPERVVFLRGRGPYEAAAVYELPLHDGARPRLLGRLPQPVDVGYTLALSADGRHLASEDLWAIVDLVSSSAVPIEGSRPFASGPAWSADGRLLVFVGANRGVHDFVVIADTNGRIVRKLGPAYLGDVPTWSRDGRWIAYANTKKGLDFVSQIHVVRADGTFHRVITSRTDAENTLPIWSPDGRTIVYQNGGTLRRIAVDGSDDELLSDPGGGADACATFSPDGSRIAFLRSAASGAFSPAHSIVVVMDRDGSSQHAVRTR